MATFDPNQLLEALKANETNPDTSLDLPSFDIKPVSQYVSTKMADVDEASERNKNALTTRLGITADTPILGMTVNNAASVWSGAARLTSNLLTTPTDTLAGLAEMTVPGDVFDAYSRIKIGEPQPGDEDLLQQQAPSVDGIGQTYANRIESINKLRQTSKTIADTLDISSIVDDSNRQNLSDDIRQNTEEGVARLRESNKAFNEGDYAEAGSQALIGGFQTIRDAVGSVATNPRALGEYVGENVPQLALGAKTLFGMAAANVGYGLNEYRDGITDYQAENKGALPSSDEMTTMALSAAGASLAEQVGDAASLKGLLEGGKGGLRKALKEMGEASLKEGATEGVQTKLENNAHLKDTSLEDIVESAAIGAGVGGTFAGAGAVGNRGQEAQTERPKVEEEFNKAVETGDVTPLSDVNSPTYNPVRAVEALHQTILKDGATDEQIQSATQQVDDIQSNIQQQIDDLQDTQRAYQPEEQAKFAEQLESVQAQLATESDPAVQAELTEQAQGLQYVLEDAKSYTDERRQQDDARIEQLQTQLNDTQEAVAKFQVSATPAQESVEDTVSQVNVPVAEASQQTQQATDKLLTLTMTNPDALSSEQVSSLVSNQDNGLTPTQRTALQTFGQAKEAEDALKNIGSVRTDITSGGNGFRGLPQFRNDLRLALDSGNIERAQQVADSLTQFAETRQSKADAISSAYEDVKGTDNTVYVAPDEQGIWGPVPAKVDGGIAVSAKTFAIRDAVRLEATALKLNAQSFNALIQDKQATPVQTGSTQPEQVAGVEGAAPEVAPAETGVLTALQTPTEVTPDTYKSSNLLSGYFTQKPEATLAKVKNFMSAIRDGSVPVVDHLPVKELNGKQRDAIKTFSGFSKAASPVVQRVFNKAKAAGYQYQDAAGFFRNEDGTIDENVVTAINYGMHSYIKDAASRLINTADDINAILHKDPEDEVTNAQWAALRRIGTREFNAEASIGASIYQALGLQAKPDAPVNERARIESSLGRIAMNAMIEMGIAERPQLSAQEFADLSGKLPLDGEASHRFFRLIATEDANGKPILNKKAEQIKKSTVGTQSVVDALFSVDKTGVEPSFKPMTFNQSVAKGTQQEISQYQKDALDKVAKQPNVLHKGIWAIWQQISPEARYAMAGVVDMDATPVHIENRDSQKAKNAGLIQEVDNAEEFFNTMLDDPTLKGEDQPVYFMPSVWRNYRVGLASNVINPQTSKVHRYLMTMPEWDAELNFNDSSQMDMFKLRILESFGVKTEGKSTAAVLADVKKGYEAQLAKPAIQAAIEAINTDGDEAAILAGVKEAGEGYHSLAGLVALAEMQRARDAGKTSFVTSLPGEVDGVTNGPQLSLQMMGSANTAISSQGGFFEIGQLDANGNQLEQFSDYHGMTGNLDMYESLISKVLRNLNTSQAPLVGAIEGIVGVLRNMDTGAIEKAGRNIIKTPLTALMFGSAPARAAASMAETFVENIYTKIESLAKTPEDIAEVVGHINTLIGTRNLRFPADISYKDMMETRFSKPQVEAIKNGFYKAIGQPTEEMFKNEFGTFLARRDAVNKAAGTAFKIYEAVHNTVRDQILEQSGNVPKDGKGNPLHDLTAAQLKELDQLTSGVRPVVNTAMSLRSNQRNAGMLMAKTKSKQSRTVPYSSEMNFGTDIGGVVDAQGNPLKPTKSTKTFGRARTLEEPGVGPASMLIHSSDSAAATGVYSQIPAVNVHDAVITGWNDLANAGQLFNQSVFNTLMNFSAPTEMRKTLEGTLAGLAPLLQDPVLGPKIAAALKESFKDKRGNFQAPAKALEEIRNVARTADAAKFERFSKTHAVGQYATEGGSYVITDADRARLAELASKIGQDENPDALKVADSLTGLASGTVENNVAGIKQKLSTLSVQTLAPATTLNTLERAKKAATPEVKQAIETIQESMVANNTTLAQAKTVVDDVMQAEVVDAVNATTKPERSVWGELGTPLIASDANLVAMLEAKPETTVHALVDQLSEYIGQTAGVRQAEYLQRLLAKVKQSTKQTASVQYVTRDTGPDGAVGEGVNKARGWFAARGGVGTVYIKSTDFVESGINAELLVHELVHSALASTIQRELDAKAADPKYTSPAYALVSDLETLRAKAQEFISNNGELSAKFANATSNVHELVSWGLTNGFFQRDVLKAITMENTQKNNPLVTGLKRFIDRVTGLLFRGPELNKANTTGMGLLMNHVAGLFEQAAKLQDSKDNLTLKYEDAADQINRMTTMQVYEALSKRANVVTDAAHDAQLRGLLGGIVSKLYGPHGAFQTQMAQDQALTAEDVFLKALDTGRLPFASTALASQFVLNQQEQYVLEQVEATVKATFNAPQTLFVRDSLARLYKDAKAQLKADGSDFYKGDWATAGQDQKDLAKAKYDFLFTQENNINGTSDYLSRFAALGMASAEVNFVLNFATSDPTKKLSELSWGKKLIELFQRLVTKLGSLQDKTFIGQRADFKLAALVDVLTDIQAKYKRQELNATLSLMDQAETRIEKAGEAVRKGAAKVGDTIAKAKSPIIKAVGKSLSAVANDRVESIMGAVLQMRDNRFPGQRQGITSGIITEMRGINDTNRVAAELNTSAKANEQRRQQTKEGVTESVVKAFHNLGADLTQDTKASLTKLLLRTNAHTLMDHLGLADLQKVIDSPAELAKATQALEAQVKQLPNGRYYMAALKDLAYHKVVGGSVSANQMLNTQNIAMLYGTAKSGQVQLEDAKEMLKVLDPLMSLYALTYTDQEHKRAVSTVMTVEAARGKESGIEYLLKLHKRLLQDSTEQLFDKSEALQISGYVPEIHDGKIEVGFINKRDAEYFQKRGYTIGGKAQVDPAVSGEPLLVATRRGAGQTGILTGAVSYTGLGTKGSKLERKIIDLMSQPDRTDPLVQAQVAQARAQEIADMFNKSDSYDPRKAEAGKLVPVLNPDGTIVGYRYMMTENNRDAYLDRNSAMDEVLGTLASQIVDKVDSVQQNNEVVAAMYDQYREEYASRPSSFITVGKDSADPAVAELYRLLPKSTKAEIKRIWKGDNMYIRADMLDMIMGYRKVSLTQAFGKRERSLLNRSDDPTQRSYPEEILVKLTGAIWGEKAELRVGQAEDVWQELVKEAKDILVVKNISTLVGNIVSNMTLLAWEGVPLKQAIQSHAIGLKGVLSYRSDLKRANELMLARDAGYVPNGLKALEDELVELNDRMARNPVKPLIDAGLMPTIAEDLEATDSSYSYKSRLGRKTERLTNKLPPLLKTVAKNVYMTHDTSTYKFLSQTTQLSDFVARYAQYVHTTTRAKDRLNKAEALRQAEDSFINYDLPSHRSLQYLNDMGIVWFTKYFLRIQKTLARMVKEKPARALAMVAYGHYVSGAQTVMDSSWIHHIGNDPFRMGAFTYPGTLDQLPAIKGLMTLTE